jgi:hypothetical protein
MKFKNFRFFYRYHYFLGVTEFAVSVKILEISSKNKNHAIIIVVFFDKYDPEIKLMPHLVRQNYFEIWPVSLVLNRKDQNYAGPRHEILAENDSMGVAPT